MAKYAAMFCNYGGTKTNRINIVVVVVVVVAVVVDCAQTIINSSKNTHYPYILYSFLRHCAEHGYTFGLQAINQQPPMNSNDNNSNSSNNNSNNNR